jgi:hypothetical protein
MAKSLKARSPLAARQKQLIAVDDMTGGVDLRRSQTLMDPSRARTTLNVSLEEPGALLMRPGYIQASSAALFSGRAQGGQRVYLANAVFNLVAGGGAIYRPSDAWEPAAAVYSTLSSANQIYFPYDRDLVMAMDGSNRPRMSTNGSTWHLSGIDAPSSAAVASSQSSGALSSGEYAFAYTYKHRGTAHESNGSSESTITLSASTGAIHLTASPSTDAKVDAYVWYGRHKTPDGESVLRKISSGAASTFTVTSSNWTSNDEIPTNHNVPVNGLRFAVSWKNRWWAPSGTIGNRLYFTELFLPQAWPSLFFIDIPFEKGDSITALVPHGDTLLVYGQSGLFLVIGQTSLDFEVRPSQGADTGAFGPRAAVRVEQSVIHISADSMASNDGASDRNISHDIGPAHRDLVSNSASTSLELVAMVHDDLRHEVRFSVPRVYPTGARGEWILHLDRTRDQNGVPALTTTDRDIHLYIHWDGNEPTAGNRGRLFSMPSTSGIVYEENVGASANSSNMRLEYEGAGISMGLHRARVVDAHVEYEPHGGTFSIEPVIDGVSQGAITLNIGAGLYTYGTGTYGSATYGGAGRAKAYTPLPIEANGRSVVTKFVYVGQERMKVFTHAYGVVPEVKPLQVS